MSRQYPHPTLGRFHKLDTSESSTAIHYVPDAALEDLVRFLDAEERIEKEATICLLLTEMLELENIEPPVWSETIDGPMMVMRHGRGVPNPLLKKVAPAKYKLEMEIDRRVSLINRTLAQYRFVPYARPVPGRLWAVDWGVSRKGRKRLEKLAGLPEGMVIRLIVDLGRAGYLNRLRRCSRCKKWLYAKFRHQRYCSTNCQQKDYAHSEEWRGKRRAYMRNYRQMMSSGKK
jgi:hypothetical protein